MPQREGVTAIHLAAQSGRRESVIAWRPPRRLADPGQPPLRPRARLGAAPAAAQISPASSR